jgi:hypothetical protein
VVAGPSAAVADEPTKRVCVDFILKPHSTFFNANPVRAPLHGIFFAPQSGAAACTNAPWAFLRGACAAQPTALTRHFLAKTRPGTALAKHPSVVRICQPEKLQMFMEIAQ